MAELASHAFGASLGTVFVPIESLTFVIKEEDALKFNFDNMDKLTEYQQMAMDWNANSIVNTPEESAQVDKLFDDIAAATSEQQINELIKALDGEEGLESFKKFAKEEWGVDIK
jgi:hypothetical protein